MPENHIKAFRALAKGSGINHPHNRHTPLDSAGASIGNVIPLSALVGMSEFSFNFYNQGGTDNLLPGRATTQVLSYNAPEGAGAFVCMNAVSGAFVTGDGTELTERPLGQFLVNVFFSGSNQISCTIMLSDSNGDDPVAVYVNGLIVFVR
jgi:hypothetical protein